MTHSLESLSFCMDKAFTWFGDQKIDHLKVIKSSLAPDMKDFAFQIELATKSARFVLTRVTGMEVKESIDLGDEPTFQQLQGRVKETIEMLKTAMPKQFEGRDQAPIAFSTIGHTLELTGLTYLQYWGLPHFFFHVVTAYDLMRHAGAPLGKVDFISGGKTELPK